MTEFHARFGRPPDAQAHAPARVNLIGEHTDYNGGPVLPIALPLGVTAALARRDDGCVQAATTLAGVESSAEYGRGEERRRGGWIDYVQAITQALDREAMVVPGFDLLIASTVPAGGGLASSAALEVAILRALRIACALAIDDLRIAQVAHRAETGLVGAPVGIMDQMVASLGDQDAALWIDSRTLATARVPLPDTIELAILDSGITHQHATGDYRTRRAECSRAAAALGVDLLADLSPADLPRVAALPPPLDRRARHVITESVRVAESVAALRAGDGVAFGRLVSASHASLRDDFEVSLPEIDTLVAIATAEPGVLGARLTGGGFGGAVLVICARGSAGAVADRVQSAYQSRTGRAGRVLLPLGAGGGTSLDI